MRKGQTFSLPLTSYFFEYYYFCTNFYPMCDFEVECFRLRRAKKKSASSPLSQGATFETPSPSTSKSSPNNPLWKIILISLI